MSEFSREQNHTYEMYVVLHLFTHERCPSVEMKQLREMVQFDSNIWRTGGWEDGEKVQRAR